MQVSSKGTANTVRRWTGELKEEPNNSPLERLVLAVAGRLRGRGGLQQRALVLLLSHIALPPGATFVLLPATGLETG